MIQGQLVCMFVMGLHDEKNRHDVFAQCPDTLGAAIIMAGAAAHAQALSGTPGRGERQEEAMGIGSSPPPPPTWTVTENAQRKP